MAERFGPGTTYGVLPMVSTENKAQLVVLSTRNANVKDSTLSDVTWMMQEIIKAIDNNFAAVISLRSMQFYNMFYNIEAPNNVLKILSTWVDTGVAQQDIITVTIRPGQYSTASLVDYLNLRCNKIVATRLYGFGKNGDATQPGFAYDTNSNQLIFQPPKFADLTSTYASTHNYSGFFLVYDNDTQVLMQQLGLIQSQSGQITTPGYGPCVNSTTNLYGIGFLTQSSAPGTFINYQVPENNPNVYPTPVNSQTPTGVAQLGNFPADLSAAPTLIVSWEQVNASARVSVDNLVLGDTICEIPVTVSYGVMQNWSPPVKFESVTTSLQANTFRLQVRRADTGALVDFKGLNWVVSIAIEFRGIENQDMSSSGQAGNYKQQMPLYHGDVRDHLLPFSGLPPGAKRKRLNFAYNPEADPRSIPGVTYEEGPGPPYLVKTK